MICNVDKCRYNNEGDCTTIPTIEMSCGIAVCTDYELKDAEQEMSDDNR